VANNNFHDNGGYGIWCDGNCSNVTIQDNWVHDEGLSGIQYEISGQALIQGNLSENNGLHYFSTDWPDGDGIRVKTSHDVTVQYNIVRNNKNGIVGESFSTDAGTFANNVFQYNAVTMLQGTSGIWWQSGSFPSGSTWIDNTYTLSGIAALAWSSGTHLTLAQWQALGNQ
jgi:parallel beta-helix repeat protein